MSRDDDEHCCKMMREQFEWSCPDHAARFDCPDALPSDSPTRKSYGIVVHDGGTSSISIAFCPWCGGDLSRERR